MMKSTEADIRRGHRIKYHLFFARVSFLFISAGVDE